MHSHLINEKIASWEKQLRELHAALRKLDPAIHQQKDKDISALKTKISFYRGEAVKYAEINQGLDDLTHFIKAYQANAQAKQLRNNYLTKLTFVMPVCMPERKNTCIDDSAEELHLTENISPNINSQTSLDIGTLFCCKARKKISLPTEVAPMSVNNKSSPSNH